MLCKTDSEVRKRLKVADWTKYEICNQVGTVEFVSTWDDKKAFQEMDEALGLLKFREEQRMHLYLMIATVLTLGNIKFAAPAGGQQGCVVLNEEQLELCASMLKVPPAALTAALTTRNVVIKDDRVKKLLEAPQAAQARNALCMHVYSLAFDSCVHVMNQLISRPKDAVVRLGLLDIFGFENFAENAFPQLCINLTNESLHNLFIEHVFKLEQQIYLREDIEWKFVEYDDNQAKIDLIIARPVCVFGLLDEASSTNQSATATVSNLHNMLRSKTAYKVGIARPIKYPILPTMH